MSDAPAAEVRLPDRTRLVHIGPHKTGTTALQAAFHAARPAAEAQGVHYAGRDRHSASAVYAVLDDSRRSRSILHWYLLRREIRSSRARCVVLSSELLSYAQPADARRVVRDLDPGRVHVAVTLRPLVRILPSQWQQNVQGGSRMAYDAFLEAVFHKPSGRVARTFWHRHRHDALVERWAEVVGPDRVTVVAVDEQDPGMLLRSFEALTGLAPATLRPVPDLRNRSLTFPEAEALRAMNRELRQAGVAPTLLVRVNESAMQSLKQRQPADGEGRVETPAWALEAAADAQRRVVDGLRATGVRVIGDLEALVAVPGAAGATTAAPALIPAEVAARLGSSIFDAAGLADRGEQGYGSWLRGSAVEPAAIAGTPSYRLVGVLVNRGIRSVLTPFRALRRRGGSPRGGAPAG
jgi:hypothetical protein